MKNFFLLSYFSFLISYSSFPQNVGIGTTTPNASALLDINSPAKGLLIPRMTTAAINAISNPAKGLMLYDSSKNQLMVNMGTPSSHNWQTIVAGSGWKVTGNSGTNPSTQFIGTTDNNPLQFRMNNKYAGKIDSLKASTFLGYLTGSNNTFGYGNIGIGCKSLYSNTKGHNNTAVGDSSLFSDTIGSYNTAIGTQSLFSNTRSMNTAAGAWALYSSTDGYNNTAIGSSALYQNSYGSSNTAMGAETLSYVNGFDNTATGYQALFANTNGSGNTATGGRALWNNLTGASNTANGFWALNSNQTGANNTATGYAALYNNYSGSYNTANGSLALYTTQFTNGNTASGYSALRNTYGITDDPTTGVRNTGTGAEALYSNTTGAGNTATGYQALYSNFTANNNTAMGTVSLYSNTTGSNNTAIGFTALYSNTTMGWNTAAGENSLLYNTGAYNTAAGGLALSNTSSAQFNTVVGFNSAANHNMSYNNSFLGANCDVPAPGYYNCIAIGQAVTCTAVSQARIGNSATWSIGGYANWSNFSDGRYKKDLTEDVKGLDFIMKLRPVTYHLDISGISKKLNESRGKEMDESMKKAIAGKEKMTFSGFVAQEVEQSARELNYDFSGIEKPANPNSLYALRYDQFVAPLIKAMQEQQQTIAQLKKENAALKNFNTDEDKIYEKLLIQIEKLETFTPTLKK